MNKDILKILVIVLSLCIALPIWFYLVYFLLKNTGAGELQMFLFWVYVPLTVLTSILSRLLME